MSPTERFSAEKKNKGMERFPRLLLVLFLLLVFVVLATPASAQAPPDPFSDCDRGVFAETGASWVICMPARIQGVAWNGDLIIYAHGYVSPYPDRPPEIPLGQYMLPGGTSFPNMANGLGYAFAATSFRTNGLAVKDGVADIMDLLGEFKAQYPLKRPSRVYLFGASEGGLIVAKAIEKHSPQFDGGVAACGPIGDFRIQVDYFSDMRVIFDYFFADMLPPTAIEIPETLMADWLTIAPGIGLAVWIYPEKTMQLLAVTQAPVDPAVPSSSVDTVLGVLWYNVFATNDARAKLGGNPFDNTSQAYSGSLDDTKLNNKVARYEADRNALAAIRAQYQTTGHLRTPLLTMHNILDPIVPYAHATLYEQKVAAAGSSGLYQHIEAPRYGHCNFTSDETLAALYWVITMSGGQSFTNARDVMPSEEAYQRYLNLTSDFHARP
jgi:pimeloyl-ACP methyl ester carboxylesterase